MCTLHLLSGFMRSVCQERRAHSPREELLQFLAMILSSRIDASA
jgi:hypothetical protein